MTDRTTPESDTACIYYAGCDEPRKPCGFCPTHCRCDTYVTPPGSDGGVS